MNDYNDIGISRQLDFPRIQKLLRIGIFASVLAAVGDLLLGYGVTDNSLTGIERQLSAYIALSDARIFWSSFTGFVGITLLCMSYFGVYRLMADRSPKYAHLYRTGIFGQMMFAACGNHVVMLACVYFYKHMLAATGSFNATMPVLLRFAGYFLLPSVILEVIFFYLQFIVQFLAFRKGYTPLPKWCAVFNPIVVMAVVEVVTAFIDYPIANAVNAAWMNLGHIFTFGGLLFAVKRFVRE